MDIFSSMSVFNFSFFNLKNHLYFILLLFVEVYLLSSTLTVGQ